MLKRVFKDLKESFQFLYNQSGGPEIVPIPKSKD